jgi:hypothetical protein
VIDGNNPCWKLYKEIVKRKQRTNTGQKVRVMAVKLSKNMI